MTHNEETHRDSEGGTDGPPVKLIAFLLVAAALVVFVVQNGDKARVKFLWLEGAQYTWLIIVVSAVAGAILAKLAGWMWTRSRDRRSDR